MPGRPIKVMTLKGDIDDKHDKYMVVSFPDSTLVLSIGGEKVSQVTNSGF